MMTQAEKLEALMQKAFDGGWKTLDGFKHMEIVKNAEGILLAIRFHKVEDFDAYGEPTLTYSLRDLLFQKPFARALFGEDSGFWHQSGSTLYFDPRLQAWELQLQQAVISDNPIDYMYKEVFGDEQH